MPALDHLDRENARLLDIVRERDELLAVDPGRLLVPLFPRCTVRMLLVTDGSLDFGSGDFGLRTFIKTIQAGATITTRYSITLAHRQFRSGDAMLDGDATITRRITDFHFDNAAHFSATEFDQVWLFGFESSTFLPGSELLAITKFMDDGGGVFATGDHGTLGRAMGQDIPRVRSMRLWNSTPAPDEVSMTGFRRNDTNRRGHDLLSSFDDQSDDVPQTITPKMYSTNLGFFRVVYPHPLLCGRDGVIDAMPDHPHEGECVAPKDLSTTVTVGGQTFVEYPAAIDGGAKPRPEVISTSTVLAGTTSGSKDPTDGHTFGGISAYDGHRAGIGRVVTDATWHHFVNINLIGEIGAAPPKNVGFLASATGETHLNMIKNYYRNIAIWISRPTLIRCMNRRWLWWIVQHSRVVEAVATGSDAGLARADARLLFDIGAHARDVLGRHTSACQRIRLVLDLMLERIPRPFIDKGDPWLPRPDEKGPRPVPWFDPTPLIDIAFGGAILAVREKLGDVREIGEDDAEKFDRILDAAVAEGLATGLERARESAGLAVDEFSSLVM